MRNWGRPLFLAAVISFAASGAQAQRAADNAVVAAQDAFGTTVGNESIGLYSSGSARGFSPVQAGNLRIEGLYFFQPPGQGSQTGLDSQLSSGSTIRVGLTAQSYPFPAPTGIVDYRLRLPGDTLLTSVVANYDPYDTYKGEVNVQTPIIADKLGILVAASGGYDTYNWGGDTTSWIGDVLLRWRPTDNLEIIPFWSHLEKYGWESGTQIFMAGPFLPPDVKHRGHFTQGWADYETRDTNYGMVARWAAGKNWTLRAGAFRAWNARPERNQLSYRNTLPNGEGDLYLVRDPPQANDSYSGEVRASGLFAEGPRLHTVHIAARGYTVGRSTGGGNLIFVGRAIVGVYDKFPEPAVTYSPQANDRVRQGNLAVGYEGRWAKIGEMSFGIQKAFYSRRFDQPGRPLAQSKSKPWLYSGTMAVFVTDSLTAYGSYTRGLEESAVAPESAANRGEALPANITEQVDAGVRYVITPAMRVVAGVFEVKKPFLDRDAASVFTTVGAIKHRGIEASFTGQPLEGLTIVAGAVLLRARVSGFTVDQGLIATIPTGVNPRLLRLNVQYGPKAWDGLSVETQVEHKAAQPANRLNTYKVPSTTIINLGGRYQFSLLGAPASLRVQVLNITDKFVWSVNGSAGFFMPTDSRRYTARLSADF
jgi:iron complex outermembrane receptor protein